MKKKKLLYYTAVLLFLILAALGIYLTGNKVRLPYEDEMLEAAALHREAAELIKAERLRRGYPLTEEDTLGLGLMGLDYSPITTSTGSLGAKRTSQIPDFAALCVKLLHEAGVKEGDRVGACFSGSFPGLNLAVLCAAKVMKIDLSYSVSIGASHYGANLPGYTLPEMIQTVYDAGLISQLPDIVSMGGDGDEGRNMMAYLFEEEDEIAEIEAMKRRLEEEGIPLSKYASFSESIKDREAKMGDIAAFINVGGNILGMGDSDAGAFFGQGLLKDAVPALNEKSGLIERYLYRGVPVIQFLNVKQLCAESGIPYDPVTVPADGTSAVYFSRNYSKAAIAAAALLAFGAVIVIEWRDKKTSSERKR